MVCDLSSFLCVKAVNFTAGRKPQKGKTSMWLLDIIENCCVLANKVTIKVILPKSVVFGCLC